jgi:hypothetical protein
LDAVFGKRARGEVHYYVMVGVELERLFGARIEVHSVISRPK